VRRDTGGNYRIFEVTGGATVSLSGLTISNGYLTSNGGAGIYVDQGGLTADGIVLSGNTTTDPVNGGPGLLSATATVTIRNSAIVNNTSAGVGGGIYNFFGSNLTLVNTTISGNTAAGWDGGAIWTYAPLTLLNCTVANNSAVRGGGIAVRASTTVSVQNTILAGNTASVSDPDLSGALSTSGHNLIGNTQGGSGFATTDLLGADPLLDALQDNGGPTPTQALLSGSPALNAGTPAGAPATDQRGVARGDAVNIGAYQATATQLVLNDLPDSAAAGAALDFTVRAEDPFGQAAVGYRGTVRFRSSDASAAVPVDYVFTAADGGTHAFAGGVTFFEAGPQDLTVFDLANPDLTATATVTVQAPVAYFEIAVTGPVTAGEAFELTVTARDINGQVVTGYSGKIGLWSVFGDDDLRESYTFTADDAGSHVFTLTLFASGPEGILVTDTDALALGFTWVTVNQAG
jgi:hypothetical protein